MKNIIKIKFRPVEPKRSDWDIEVDICDGDLEEISNVSVIIAAFNDHGITDPEKMLFEYDDGYAYHDYDHTPTEHKFHYRKDGYDEAVIQYEKDVEEWKQWKLDNVDAIKAENARKKKLRSVKKEAEQKTKLEKDIAATEAKLAKLRGLA